MSLKIKDKKVMTKGGLEHSLSLIGVLLSIAYAYNEIISLDINFLTLTVVVKVLTSLLVSLSIYLLFKGFAEVIILLKRINNWPVYKSPSLPKYRIKSVCPPCEKIITYNSYNRRKCENCKQEIEVS